MYVFQSKLHLTYAYVPFEDACFSITSSEIMNTFHGFPLLMPFTKSEPPSVAIIATGRAAKAGLNGCRWHAWNIDWFWDTNFRSLISVENKGGGRQRFPFVIFAIHYFSFRSTRPSKTQLHCVDEATSGGLK